MGDLRFVSRSLSPLPRSHLLNHSFLSLSTDGEVAALALKLSQAKIIRSGTVEIADLAEGVVKEGSALKEEEVVEEEVGRVKDEL